MLFEFFAFRSISADIPVIRVIDAKFVALSPVIADEIDSMIRFFSACLGPLDDRVVDTVSLMFLKT